MDSPSTPASGSPVPPSFRPPHKLAPPPPDFPAPEKSNPAFQPTTGLKPLVLSRRVNPLQRAQAATEVRVAARRSPHTLEAPDVSSLRDQPALNDARVAALEKALAQLEIKAVEQELALATAENKLVERDRELAEAEALLRAREKVLDAVRKQPASTLNSGMHAAETSAWTRLKAELDGQAAALAEQRAALNERENLLQLSEAALRRKIQAHSG